jgi:hypothetical protein
MPETNNLSLDDIMKAMNDIHTKMRYVRNPAMIQQMQMVLAGYREEYQKRMSQDADRSKNKNKSRTDNNNE